MTQVKDKPGQKLIVESGHIQSEYDPKMLLLNEDGNVYPQNKTERRMALPVGVWAKLASIKTYSPVRVGEESEKNFFMSRDYDIIILTNRTVRIKQKFPKRGHVYTPLENIVYYQVNADAAFEQRFQESSNESAPGIEAPTETTG